MANKDDRRVLYTKLFLREALLDLMQEKPVDRITPTELCRAANINRNTFYAHYYTVRDVLSEIEQEFSERLLESLKTMFSSDGMDLSVLLREIFNIVYAQKDFCKILLSENGDAAFFEQLISQGKPFILNGWKANGMRLDDEEAEMFFAFIVSGSIALMQEWAATDMREPPEKVAKLLECATNSSLNGMMAYSAEQ
ncbi:MAG: TetR family transcriptional regulator C-terminal domain-containing protein [Clostridia bacterium]|nr:TetR family transcriptional regulator C-terminal domain-containing protein [Clostridia bacterium]